MKKLFVAVMMVALAMPAFAGAPAVPGSEPISTAGAMLLAGKGDKKDEKKDDSKKDDKKDDKKADKKKDDKKDEKHKK